MFKPEFIPVLIAFLSYILHYQELKCRKLASVEHVFKHNIMQYVHLVESNVLCVRHLLMLYIQKIPLVYRRR